MKQAIYDNRWHCNEAAKALTVCDARRLVRHVLPDCMAPIIVTSLLSVLDQGRSP